MPAHGPPAGKKLGRLWEKNARKNLLPPPPQRYSPLTAFDIPQLSMLGLNRRKTGGLLMRSFLAGLALLAATTAAHAEVIQLITNGDFSNASPAVDQGNTWNVVTSLPGWTATGGTSSNFLLSGQNAGIYPSQISGTDRGAALNLQNQAGSGPATYSQTGTVTAAVTSGTFSFYTTDFWGGNTIWQLSSNLQGVLLTGTQANTFDVWTLVSNTLSSGQAASLQAGELLTVSFRTPAGTGPGAAIDNVSLTLITVPEPSTLAGLGVIGTGLAAVIRRRLRAAKSAS